MTLRLDPRRPIVWRTPHSLQIGVDPLLARLDEVSEGDARLVDALAVGVTRAGLAMLADHAGVPDHRVEQLLAALAPALVAAGTGAAGTGVAGTGSAGAASIPVLPAIAVVGTGVGAHRVAAVLREAGHPVTLSASAGPDTDAPRGARGRRRPAAAVLVSTHVIDPRAHQRWLRRDVPHLPVVFGEAAVTVGPLVHPGTTACLGCVERRRVLDDAARTAIAAQLWGTPAAAESPALATEAAVETFRMLRAGIPTPPDDGAPSVSVRLDADAGARTATEWWPSEGCGCRGLSLLSGPAPRRETGSPSDLHAPWSPAAPTTAREPFALA